jgi:hypothetical protein
MFKKKVLYLFMVLAMLASMIPMAGAVETPQAASEPALAITRDALTLPRFEPPIPADGRAVRFQGDQPGIMEQDRQEALHREQPPGPPAPKRSEPKAAEFLVTIQADGDRFSQVQAARELEPALAWM